MVTACYFPQECTNVASRHLCQRDEYETMAKTASGWSIVVMTWIHHIHTERIVAIQKESATSLIFPH